MTEIKRKFNGKYFIYVSTCHSRSEADYKAERLRERGYYARVVLSKNERYYYLWKRKK